jgi:cytochrome P450
VVDNVALFQRCADLHGIARFRVYWYQCHVVTDPELAGAVLVANASAFKKTRALQVARPTFGNGLVTSEGEEWRRQQRLLRPFLTPRAAAGYSEFMARATKCKLESWLASPLVDLHRDMVDITLEVVCRALFGIDAGKLQPLIQGALDAVQQWHADCKAWCLPYPHYLPTAANIRYRQRTRALDREVYALIRRTRTRTEDHGMLGAMLDVRDVDGSRLSDEEIRDQLVTLFLAGHDTTASSLAFALYELSYRPDLQARIARESRLEREAESECLEQVLKETLRLYPVVHLVARTAVEDVRLGPYLVRRGEEVVLPLYVLQRSPKLFPRPDAFEPERWSDEAGTVCHRYAHLPFSAGPRVCIGQAMATAEMRSVVTDVLRSFRLEPLEPRAPRIANGMTISPARGSTRVRVTPVDDAGQASAPARASA